MSSKKSSWQGAFVVVIAFSGFHQACLAEDAQSILQTATDMQIARWEGVQGPIAQGGVARPTKLT